jgi:hypothetical protein
MKGAYLVWSCFWITKIVMLWNRLWRYLYFFSFPLIWDTPHIISVLLPLSTHSFPDNAQPLFVWTKQRYYVERAWIIVRPTQIKCFRLPPPFPNANRYWTQTGTWTFSLFWQGSSSNALWYLLPTLIFALPQVATKLSTAKTHTFYIKGMNNFTKHKVEETLVGVKGVVSFLIDVHTHKAIVRTMTDPGMDDYSRCF